MNAVGDAANQAAHKGLGVLTDKMNEAGLHNSANAIGEAGSSAINAATDALKNGKNPLEAGYGALRQHANNMVGNVANDLGHKAVNTISDHLRQNGYGGLADAVSKHGGDLVNKFSEGVKNGQNPLIAAKNAGLHVAGNVVEDYGHQAVGAVGSFLRNYGWGRLANSVEGIGHSVVSGAAGAIRNGDNPLIGASSGFVNALEPN